MPTVVLPSTRRLVRAFAVLIPLGVAANAALALATTDRTLLTTALTVSSVPLVVAGALSLVPWITQTLRIVIWTRFVGHPLSVVSGLRIYAGGILGSAVTPTAVGGGSIRWALAARRGVPAGKAASLLAVEAVEDVTFFALALPAAAVLSAPSESVAMRRAVTSPALRLDDPVFVAVGVSLGLAVTLAGVGRLALSGRFGPTYRGHTLRFVARLRRPWRVFQRDVREVIGLVARRGKGWFALSLGLTAVQWIARYSVATAVIVTLGGPLRPYLFWALGWMTYAVSSAVPTPGAAGAAEATFLLLHRPFVPGAILVASTAVWRLLLFYVPALLAAVVYPALGTVERRD